MQLLLQRKLRLQLGETCRHLVTTIKSCDSSFVLSNLPYHRIERLFFVFQR